MINVVLASNLTVLREGMKRVLHSHEDIEIIAEMKDVQGVLADKNLWSDDIVIVITQPPSSDGQDYLRHLQDEHPTPKAIVISRSPTIPQILTILRAGVRGLLDATCAASYLPTAIRTIASGGMFMHRELARLVALDLGELDRDHTHRSLTRRELEIFLKLATGDKVSQIASELGISIKTVSTHKSRLMGKMGMTTQSQLIQYAVANSLFSHSDPGA